MPRTRVVHKLGHRIKVGRGFKQIPVCRTFGTSWGKKPICHNRWSMVTCKACLEHHP